MIGCHMALAGDEGAGVAASEKKRPAAVSREPEEAFTPKWRSG
jgi:hypothetical protein